MHCAYLRVLWLNFKLKIIHWVSLGATTLATIIVSLVIAFVNFPSDSSSSSLLAQGFAIGRLSFYFNVTSFVSAHMLLVHDKARWFPPSKGDVAIYSMTSNMERDEQNSSTVVGPVSVWYARLTIDLLVKILMVIIAIAIVYPIVELRSGFGYVLLALLALWLQCFANLGIALVIASLPSEHLDYVNSQWGHLLILINLLYSGKWISEDQVTWILLWIRYLCPSYYVSQMLISVESEGARDNQEYNLLANVSNMPYYGGLLGLLGLGMLACIAGPLVFRFTVHRARSTLRTERIASYRELADRHISSTEFIDPQL